MREVRAVPIGFRPKKFVTVMVTQEENIDLLAIFSQHTTNTQPKPLVRYIAAK